MRARLLEHKGTIARLLLAAVFLRERLTGRKIIAVSMGFVGAVILNVNPSRLWSWIAG